MIEYGMKAGEALHCLLGTKRYEDCQFFLIAIAKANKELQSDEPDRKHMGH
jgi:hypothetical protein